MEYKFRIKTPSCIKSTDLQDSLLKVPRATREVTDLFMTAVTIYCSNNKTEAHKDFSFILKFPIPLFLTVFVHLSKQA